MNRIPKTIHFCWFGGSDFSPIIENCVISWKKYLPDYKIIEWNESNFDININRYVKEAYEARKFAFVSDYVRLHALYNYGGIYLDTDAEILKPLDVFLQDDGFSGFESRDRVPTAVMGSCRKNVFIKELLDYYENRTFILENGTFDLTTNVEIITNISIKYGLKLNGKKQRISNFIFYPQKYFCPNTIEMLFSIKPRRSYAIHHFEGSWLQSSNKKNKILHYIGGILRNNLGHRNYIKINRIIRRIKE